MSTVPLPPVAWIKEIAANYEEKPPPIAQKNADQKKDESNKNEAFFNSVLICVLCVNPRLELQIMQKNADHKTRKPSTFFLCLICVLGVNPRPD